MNNRLQDNLIKNLNEYRDSLDVKSDKVIQSIDIILKHIDSNHIDSNHIDNNINKVNKKSKKKNIYDLLDLVDSKDFNALKSNNIKLNFEEILERNDLILKLERLEDKEINEYTMNELKIIYYIITKDRDNYIMKANKKDILIRGIKEMILDSRRSSKLISK